MKGTLTFLLLLFIAGIAFGQSFEGRIIYRNTYHTKLNNISDEEWDNNLGTLEEYLIKDGNYRITTNGRLFEWQCYNSKKNKIYTKMGNSSSIYWNDATLDEDSVLEVEVKKSDTVVLGYKCNQVILTCKTGVQTFFYSTKFSVNPKLFEKHKFGNWYEYLNAANALPLETIIDNEQFIMTSKAIEIKSPHIDNKSFELQDTTRIVKSPY